MPQLRFLEFIWVKKTRIDQVRELFLGSGRYNPNNSKYWVIICDNRFPNPNSGASRMRFGTEKMSLSRRRRTYGKLAASQGRIESSLLSATLYGFRSICNQIATFSKCRFWIITFLPLNIFSPNFQEISSRMRNVDFRGLTGFSTSKMIWAGCQ